jgi:predicted TIM-barrel fold metal-dependent hydrolase
MAQVLASPSDVQQDRLPEDVSLVDCDTHFLPPAAMAAVARLHPRHFELVVEEEWTRLFYEGRVVARAGGSGEIAGSSQGAKLELENRVADMDQEDPHCVQVLGYDQSFPGTRYGPGIGTDVCRAINDAVVQLLDGAPFRHRFIPVATVYLPWPQEAQREVLRTHRLGFKGIFVGAIHHPYADLSLGGQRLWPTYEAINDLDLPIIYHAGTREWRDWSSYNLQTVILSTLVGSSHNALLNTHDLSLLYGAPFTYACEIADLIFSGTLDRFPNLRFAFLEGRLASYAPALMDSLDQVRLDERYDRIKLQRKPSEYFSHFYPAVTANEKWLHHTIEAWPDHNIVTGSDFPHGDASGTWPNTLRMIRAKPKLSEEDKQRILVGNARRFFRM